MRQRENCGPRVSRNRRSAAEGAGCVSCPRGKTIDRGPPPPSGAAITMRRQRQLGRQRKRSARWERSERRNEQRGCNSHRPDAVQVAVDMRAENTGGSEGGVRRGYNQHGEKLIVLRSQPLCALNPTRTAAHMGHSQPATPSAATLERLPRAAAPPDPSGANTHKTPFGGGSARCCGCVRKSQHCSLHHPSQATHRMYSHFSVFVMSIVLACGDSAPGG